MNKARSRIIITPTLPRANLEAIIANMDVIHF